MAKGIEKVIEKFAVQTIVLWANPVPDGEGSSTYNAAIEFKGRWEDKAEVKMRSNGSQYSSAANVLTNQELKVGDYLYLGTIAEINANPNWDITNPKSVMGAYEVIQMDKIPMVRKTDEFARIAYLFDYGK